MKHVTIYWIKNYLFIGVILMLCLPAIQFYFPLKVVAELKGDIEVKSSVSFNWKNWIEEEFQKKWEAYFNQQFGFRNSLVRLNNQLDFDLFSLTHAKHVVIGKDNYLYEIGYIKAYTGDDFIGFNTISEKIFKLKCIADTLAKLNKKVLVVFAAGKASYFPEYIPDKYLQKKSSITNYLVFKKALAKWGIPIIDYCSWFGQLKSTTQYPLFSKCGIHWSKYAEVLVADSLIRYLEKSMQLKLGKLHIDTIEVSQKNLYEDFDIGDGLNLMGGLETYPMAYPTFHYKDTNALNNSKVMVVADSYYWGMYNTGLSRFGFNDGQFWYYNNEIYSQENQSVLKVYDVDILNEIKKHDVIVIMNTEANLQQLGKFFIENVYDGFFNSNPNTSSVKKVRLKYFMQMVMENRDMLSACKVKMLANNTTLEYEVKEFAAYLLWRECNEVVDEP